MKQKHLATALILSVAGMWSCHTSHQVPVEKLLPILDGKDLQRHIAVLSHDSLEGRKPFTPGEDKTIAYLKDEFQKLGLKPGNGKSYFQQVPLVELYSKPVKALEIAGANGKVTLDYLNDFVGGTRRVENSTALSDAEVVFVGHGVVAPEYGWNDYEGIDVKGKVVIALANDPGFSDASLFKGKNMTYYGRWTYKFEEATRQGAAGVLLIHEPSRAGYGWNVVRSSWGKSKLYLQSEDGNLDSPKLEGWISTEAAKRILALSGQSEALLEKALQKGFKPVTLGAKASVGFENEIKKSVSNNVAALLPGKERKDEVIVYTAHWDHLGIGEAIEGDSIYNGAVDNATGTAGLLEIAKAYVAAGQTKRSVLFLAVTAEEQGLLGSEYYSKHPLFPAKKTVANINMDALQPHGRTKDMTIIGAGQSDLEEIFIEVAAKRGREAKGVASTTGAYFRSDHFNFAKIGVPAVYAGSGNQPLDMTKEAFEEKSKEYGRRGYHSPFDEYVPEKWDIRGMLEEMKIFFEVGYQLSNSDVFPQWKPNSEFKAIRDKQ